jgi:hypothetical protein
LTTLTHLVDGVIRTVLAAAAAAAGPPKFPSTDTDPCAFAVTLATPIQAHRTAEAND